MRFEPAPVGSELVAGAIGSGQRAEWSLALFAGLVGLKSGFPPSVEPPGSGAIAFRFVIPVVEGATLRSRPFFMPLRRP